MNGNIEIKNRGWFWWFFFSYYTVMGEASCAAADSVDSGKCWVNFGGGETKQEGRSGYNVLYTDYENVSLVYACEDSVFGKDESGWILTRAIEITDDQNAAYEKEFKRLMPTWGGSLSRHE